MKHLLVLSVIMTFLPLSIQAQDDDMYFVPTKKTQARSQLRMSSSSYESVPSQQSSDGYRFTEEPEYYADSAGDFSLTRQMTRFDGYTPTDAYWEGYDRGRSDEWSLNSWHSPWYYSSFYPWYDSYWYGPSWTWSFSWSYDPWYYRRPYYSWGWGYRPYYASWHYRPYRYSSWHYRPGYSRSHIGAGTINRYGRTNNAGRGYRGGTTGGSTNNRSGSSRSFTYGRQSNNNTTTALPRNNSTTGTNRSYSGGTNRSSSYSSSSSSSRSSMGSGSRSGGYSGGSRSGGSSGGGSSRRR